MPQVFLDNDRCPGWPTGPRSPASLAACWTATEGPLAPYAMRSDRSAGRRHPQSSHPYRLPFQRDRDRVLHSSAYRRLSNKTQVFTGELGDYHRTRLTHTLEVACIARTIGRALRVNEDLVETLALLHDIGHPPFGHTGEQTLDECVTDDGGFNHNQQALRIAETLERRYPEFPGLNLSLEVLEGQAYRVHKISTPRAPLVEVQVVDAADSIAYDTHDVDDALQLELLSLDELEDVPLWREAVQLVEQRFTALDDTTFRHAVVHALIDHQVGDVIRHALLRLAREQVDSVDRVRSAGLLVGPGDELAPMKIELESFLFERVYRHPQVVRYRSRVENWLRSLFEFYRAAPERLPSPYDEVLPIEGPSRAIADFLACLTDRHAQRLYLEYCG